MSTRLDRRTIATPPKFVALGMRPDEGTALRAAHFIFAIEGQESYSFPIRNHDRISERVSPDKKVELKTYFPHLAVRAIVQPGRSRKEVRAAALSELAAYAGYKSESSVWRNRVRSKLLKVVPKRFAGANRYTLTIPEGKQRPSIISADAWWPPSIAQLRSENAGSDRILQEGQPRPCNQPGGQTSEVSQMQSADEGATRTAARWGNDRESGVQQPDAADSCLHWRGDIDGLAGYFYVPPWVWNPLNPVGMSARIVMSYLCARGFLQRDEHGRVRTHVQLSPLTIGKAVSMRPETVRAALRQWEHHEVLEIVRPPAKRLEGQEGWEQEPLIIVFRPSAVLTHDLREVERKRILGAAAAMRQHTYWQQCGKELQRTIFEHLWEAQRNGCSLLDFRRNASRLIAEQNVPADVVSNLFSR